MSKIKHETINTIPVKHKCEHEKYEYYKRVFLSGENANQCTVSIYEIPPQKSAYPYHFHLKNEEVFYIISGNGLLRTPDGEKRVSAGDLLYFPANSDGAHKLANSSDVAPLVYLDFDTTNDIDIAYYPDSDKFGVWGMNINKVYRTDENVDYYEKE